MRITLLAPAAFLASAALVPTSAFATTYLTTEQAQHALFPDADRFATEVPPASAAGNPPLAVWRALKGQHALGLVVVDHVIGKFEFIDYALGIDTTGAIRQVEIMAYRESHGYEVRLPAWRRQFIGKTAASPLSLSDDIANISGATLSCRHLTDRIRTVLRLLAPAVPQGSRGS